MFFSLSANCQELEIIDLPDTIQSQVDKAHFKSVDKVPHGYLVETRTKRMVTETVYLYDGTIYNVSSYRAGASEIGIIAGAGIVTLFILMLSGQ